MGSLKYMIVIMIIRACIAKSLALICGLVRLFTARLQQKSTDKMGLHTNKTWCTWKTNTDIKKKD